MGIRIGKVLKKRWREKSVFDVTCTRCERLVDYLRDIRSHPQCTDYYCKPVPSFGSDNPQLLIVGLAPGKDGANRTGRPFTGDYAGEVLYHSLHHFGFATAPKAISAHDSLRLLNCRITNAVKCVPPDNKPIAKEIKNCNYFLKAELALLPVGAIILALGWIAHNAVLDALQLRRSAYPFKHGKVWELENGKQMLDSYHCSRYNINTGRLSKRQFSGVIAKAKRLLDKNARSPIS